MYKIDWTTFKRCKTFYLCYMLPNDPRCPGYSMLPAQGWAMTTNKFTGERECLPIDHNYKVARIDTFSYLGFTDSIHGDIGEIPESMRQSL